MGRRRPIEVASGLGDTGQDVQRVDRQPDLPFGVETLDAGARGRFRFVEPPQQGQVPGDNPVVQCQQPAVHGWLQQVVRLAEGVKRSFELLHAHQHRGEANERVRSTGPVLACTQRADRRFTLEHRSRGAERLAHEIAVPDLGGRVQLRTARPPGPERVTKPARSFDRVTVDDPQPHHSRRQRQRRIGVLSGDEPVERGPQVPQVRGEAFPPDRPAGLLAGRRGPSPPSAR